MLVISWQTVMLETPRCVSPSYSIRYVEFLWRLNFKLRRKYFRDQETWQRLGAKYYGSSSWQHCTKAVSSIRLNVVRAQRQYALHIFSCRARTKYVHRTFCSISVGVLEIVLAQGAVDKVDAWHGSGLLRRPFYVQQWIRGTLESAARADATIDT